MNKYDIVIALFDKNTKKTKMYQDMLDRYFILHEQEIDQYLEDGLYNLLRIPINKK